MLRRINLFLRGRSLSGSNRRWWAGVAEAGFAAALLVLGVILLAISLTLAVLNWSPDGLYISLGYFILQVFLSIALFFIGGYWIVRLIWDFGVSAERRGALATRAGELELLKELRQTRDHLPAIPVDRFSPLAGTLKRFRLVPSPRNIWGLLTSGVFTIVLTATLTILVIIVAMAMQNQTSRWEVGIERSIGPDRMSQIPDVPWIAAVLVVPILLALGWSLFHFVRQLLKVTGIGPTIIEVSSYPFTTGGDYQIALSQTGRVRLKLLDVTLICQEEVTYDQGTDIRTEKRQVFESRLFRQRGIPLRKSQPFRTEFSLSIPAGAMHSFKSTNNRVQWKIVVTAQAKNWPRLKRNFAVSVFPVDPFAGLPQRGTSNPAILISTDCRSYPPGGFLTCEYKIESVDAAQISAIETSVIWLTEGKGSEDIGVHFFERRLQNSPGSQTFEHAQRLSTLLPSSPLSYDGQILKIRWCVRVRIFFQDGQQLSEDCFFQLGDVARPETVAKAEVETGDEA